jgi:hypothetical protein
MIKIASILIFCFISKMTNGLLQIQLDTGKIVYLINA